MAGDVFLCLGLVAQATGRVKLGTGVAVVGARTAPVAAHGIATVNQLAPGRAVFGIGTGNSARRAMGMRPCSLAEFQEYIGIVRALLQGQEAIYQEKGELRRIRFFHTEYEFINARDPIPIFLAANMPKAMEMAGNLGDGWVTSRTNTVKGYEAAAQRVKKGAQSAGKKYSDLNRVLFTSACLLRPDETLESPRVMKQAGPWAAVALHSLYETLESPDLAPSNMREAFSRYSKFMNDRLPKSDDYYLRLHDGHCLYVNEWEEEFISPEVIKATTLTGSPEELLERLRALEKAGVHQVTFIPPYGAFEEFVQGFADAIIKNW